MKKLVNHYEPGKGEREQAEPKNELRDPVRAESSERSDEHVSNDWLPPKLQERINLVKGILRGLAVIRGLKDRAKKVPKSTYAKVAVGAVVVAGVAGTAYLASRRGRKR